MSLNRAPDKRPYLRPVALHSGLSMAEQMQVFEPTPSDSRKVVVATNIAEVSPRPPITAIPSKYLYLTRRASLLKVSSSSWIVDS